MKGYKIDYKVKTNPKRMKRLAKNMFESFDGSQDSHYFKPVSSRLNRFKTL